MKKLFILFLICSFAISAYAADPDNLRIFPQDQPMIFRGLDDTSSPVFVEDGRAKDILNVKFSTSGSLVKRDGYSLIRETLDDYDLSHPAITGIYDANFSDGTSKTFAIVGKRLKYDDGTNWITVTDDGGLITTGKNNQFVFAMANDTLIGTNDTDVPIVITGTPGIATLDVSDLSDTLTKAKCVVWYREHLILANTVENSTERNTRIRWSNVGYTETWSDDDYIDVATNTGEEINALAELYGDLFIFLDNSIYKASYVGGDEIYVLSKVVSGIGCVAKNSVQTITMPNNQMGIVFLSKGGFVYLFNGVTAIDISELITTTLDGLNPARLKYAVSTEDGASYYLAVSISGITKNNLLLEFDYSIGEWTKHNQIDANAMAQVEESTNIVKTYFGNYKSMIYWMDNTALDNDIDGISGTVSSVISTPGIVWNTATGLQMIIPTTTGLTVSGLIGGIISITAGTGSNQEAVIADNTATAILVTNAFSTTPDSTSSFSIGAIDAYYTTKWYDLGDPTRNKLFRFLYLWGEEQTNVSHEIAYYQDFGGIVDTKTPDMSGGSSALWDTAVWDTDTWGGVEALFKQEKLTGEGRFISLKFTEDDIDEDMNIYGWNIIYDAMDVE